jgi:predicted TIM-barrel fold metal-dependent hydrolase
VIIDGHTHIFPHQVCENRYHYCQRDPAFDEIYGNDKARMIGAEDLIVAMDHGGVDRAVVCGFPWCNHDLCVMGNNAIIEAVQRFPDRLIGFCCVYPGEPETAVPEIERCVAAGIRGVGELGFYTRPMTEEDIVGMSPICEAIKGCGIPLLLHVNETVGHAYPGKGDTSLQQIYRFVCTFSDMTIILAHWGGGLFFYEMMPSVARMTRRVYYDTAASPFLYRSDIYKVAHEIIGPDRIVFGSDYPLIKPERYVSEINRAGLDRCAVEKVLGENMRDLLAL